MTSTRLTIKTTVKDLFAILFCLTVAAQARAALTWETNSIEVNARIGQGLIRTVYHFKNTGANPVSIIKVAPGNGFVTAGLTKFTFAPGETGDVKVNLDLTEIPFSRRQERTLIFTTSDNPQSPTVLHLLVHVPEIVKITPDHVYWHLGEKPLPKDIVMSAGQDIQTLTLTQLNTNGDYNMQFKTEVKGKRYRVTIAPKQTDRPSVATIGFSAESPAFKWPQRCEITLGVH